MRVQKIILFLMVLGLFLAACTPALRNDGAQVNVPTSTSKPVEVPTSDLPVKTTPAEIEPTGTPGLPANQGDTDVAATATAVRKMLAEQLGVSETEINLLSIETVQWPDSCLGAAKAGQVCAQVITPGYQFMFATGGKTHEARTDLAGKKIILVENTSPVITDTVVVFERTVNGACSRLEAGENTDYGICGEALKQVELEPMRIRELYDLYQAYAPFSAETQGGKIEFRGTGKQTATAAEQRSIVEWAWMVLQEAQSGQSEKTTGLVISWNRQGGIAGFCDEVMIYASGWAYAENCRANSTQEPRYTRLSAAQLEQLYIWMDGLQSFEEEQNDPAGAADAMAVSYSLNATGSVKSETQDRQAILDFAQEIYMTANK